MSHNASPTITQNNTIIYVDSINHTGSNFELTPVPAGTPAPIATQKMLAAMQKILISKFQDIFPGQSLPPSNHDGGYIGPWKNNIGGRAPACAIKQVARDFSNWGLPTAPANEHLPTTIVQEITQAISSQAGGAGFQSGTKQLTGSELIYWMVGYATVSIAQNENGILYVFGATEGIYIPAFVN